MILSFNLQQTKVKLQLVTQSLLDQVIDDATPSPRLPMNYNFHTILGDSEFSKSNKIISLC